MAAPVGADRSSVRAVLSRNPPRNPGVAPPRSAPGPAPRDLPRVLPVPARPPRARGGVRPTRVPHHKQRDVLLPGSAPVRRAHTRYRSAPAATAPASAAPAAVGGTLLR